jgi:hypothetical protein
LNAEPSGAFPTQEDGMAPGQPAYDATKVRGGEIVLRRPWQRIVFLGGLFGSVALLAVFWIFAV